MNARGLFWLKRLAVNVSQSISETFPHSNSLTCWKRRGGEGGVSECPQIIRIFAHIV